MLQDVRLIISSHPETPEANGTFLIVAKRDFGETYGDQMPVTFTIYQLERESKDALGEFAFIQKTKFQSEQKFCSVINAFQSELGLPNHDPDGDYILENEH